MPLKLTSHPLDGQSVSRNTVIKLVNNYLAGIGGVSTDRLKVLYPSRPDIQEANCCTFSLSEILDLVAKNKSVDAIRIYYGVHDNKTAPKPEYEGLHTVILVTCKNLGTVQKPFYQDLLVNDTNFISSPGYRVSDDPGNGLDMGTLCPPNGNCDGVTIPPTNP